MVCLLAIKHDDLFTIEHKAVTRAGRGSETIVQGKTTLTLDIGESAQNVTTDHTRQPLGSLRFIASARDQPTKQHHRWKIGLDDESLTQLLHHHR